MLIQKGANVNTNVITIPQNEGGSDEASDESKWRLRSTITPPPKATCEPVFKVGDGACFGRFSYITGGWNDSAAEKRIWN